MKQLIKLVNLEFCVSNPGKGETLRLSLSELFGIDKEAAVKLRMGYSDGSTSITLEKKWCPVIGHMAVRPV